MNIKELEKLENFIYENEKEFIKLLNLPEDYELIEVWFCSSHVKSVVISSEGQHLSTDVKMEEFDRWMMQTYK